MDKLTKQRKFVFALIGVSIGCCIGFALAEILLRLFGFGFGMGPMNPHAILHHVHPSNYRFIAYNPQGEFGGFPIFYGPDGRSMNPDEEPENNTKSLPKVALMGDSFIEAGQVPWAKSLTGILEKEFAGQYQFLNYGVSSYSPILSYLQWKNQVHQNKPAVVFLLVYSNDIGSDQEMSSLALRNSDGVITAIPGPQNGWVLSILRSFYTLRLLKRLYTQMQWTQTHPEKNKDVIGGMVEENPDLTVLSTSIVRQFSQDVESTGARFVLSAVPSKFRLHSPQGSITDNEYSDKWRVWAAVEGIHFINLIPIFQEARRKGINTFYPIDIHINEHGHRLIASAFGTYLRDYASRTTESVEIHDDSLFSMTPSE